MANQQSRKGSQIPTRFIGEEFVESSYDNEGLKKWLNKFGFHPLPWQELILKQALAFDGDNSERSNLYKTLLLIVARQNGKSEIMVILGFIYIIFIGIDVKYSSYRRESATQIYNRFVNKIGRYKTLKKYFPDKKQTFSKEMKLQAVDPATGEDLGSIRFTTRAGGGGRGETFPVNFIDEAQLANSDEMAALVPTINSFSRWGQVLFFGTAPSYQKIPQRGRGAAVLKDQGVFMRNLRKQIIEGKAKNSCLIEWVQDKWTNKEDINALYRTNPSLGYSFGKGRGLTEKALLSSTLSDEDFLIEQLSYMPEQSFNRVIDYTLWQSLEEPKKKPENIETLSLAIKSNASEDQLDLVVAARASNNEIIHLDLIKTITIENGWEDVFWPTFSQYYKNKIVKNILIDGKLASASVIALLQKKGVWSAGSSKRQGKISLVSAAEIGSACLNFKTLVIGKKIRHMGQKRLNLAVEDAGKRIIRGSSSGFGFESMSGKVDINAVETAALAADGVNRVLSNDNMKQIISDLNSESDNEIVWEQPVWG